MPDPELVKNISNVGRIIGSSRIVGLGESTHGTYEFFVNKSKIIQQLVKEHGFNTLLFEDNQDQVEKINEYNKTGDGSLKSIIKTLYRVWQTQELIKLFQWMRVNYNKYPTNLVGFDIDQSKVEPKHRDKFMAENIRTYISKSPNSKCIVWAHNFHIAKTRIGEFSPMGRYLQKWFGKDYYAIAQLFGRGELSATIINEASPDNYDRNIDTILAKSIPKEFFEHYLDSLSENEFIVETKDLSKETFKIKKIRSIGWGLVPSKIDMYADELIVSKAYDAVVYCPKSSRSRLIL